MKKLLLTFLALSVFSISPVSAHDRDYQNGHHPRHEVTVQNNHNDFQQDMPFQWQEKRTHLSAEHRLERVREREFKHHFPSLHAYRWHNIHDRGFWHKGHFIKEAVLFYNDSEELIQIGYMHDGVFIIIKADHSSYEHHDSFFQTWWKHSH